MPKEKAYIKNFRHILLLWFVMFALSPCIVKEVLLNAANTEYAKPLNKTKTTPANSCQYSQNEKQQISIAKQTNINKKTYYVDVSHNQEFVGIPTKTHGNYSKKFSGNSPPKYILYKCLKLDVV